MALTTNSNAAGTVHSSEQYYAYGKRDRLGAGAALPTTIDYTGQRRDGSGLIYMNARYYDPVIGQFISPDTIVPDAGSVLDYNRYLYVRGNPMGYKDDSGHIANWVIGAGVGAVAGAGLYLWNESRNGDGFNWKDLGDWRDLGVAACSGAAAGALIATPGGQAAGISMAANLVADHTVNFANSQDFSYRGHVAAAVIGAVTPGAAGLAGDILTKIPKVAQSGRIIQKGAEIFGRGLTAGTVDIIGQTTVGDSDLSLGMLAGAYVDGFASESIASLLVEPAARFFRPNRFIGPAL